MQMYRDESVDEEIDVSYNNRDGVIYGDVDVNS
jgi:hypothetical protein